MFPHVFILYLEGQMRGVLIQLRIIQFCMKVSNHTKNWSKENILKYYKKNRWNTSCDKCDTFLFHSQTSTVWQSKGSPVFAQVGSSLSKFWNWFSSHIESSFKLSRFHRGSFPGSWIFVTLLALIEHICLAKCGTSLRTKTKQCDRNFSFLKTETHCNQCTSETMTHTNLPETFKII